MRLLTWEETAAVTAALTAKASATRAEGTKRRCDEEDSAMELSESLSINLTDLKTTSFLTRNLNKKKWYSRDSNPPTESFKVDHIATEATRVLRYTVEFNRL